jgi:hypothetical protein
MFQSIDELVDENDCRRALALEGDNDDDAEEVETRTDHTLEYVEPSSSSHLLQSKQAVSHFTWL